MSATEFLGMLLPGLATGVGGLLLLAVRRPTEVTLDGMLGFTAGIMLAATAFSLLVPALDEGTVAEVVCGLLAGGLVLLALDHYLPHAHAHFAEHDHPHRAEERNLTHRGRLLLTALTIHNAPEGLAVGVAFGAGGADLGLPIAVAIGLQNVPEGFAAGAPLVEARVPRSRAALIAAATGVVEPPAAFLAFATVGFAAALLPVSLAFAAGAMLYVIVDELIPEAHSRGNERTVTVALFGGFALMLVLDNALG